MLADGFRFALCNEIYGRTPVAEIAADAAALGYDGLELAPHTLAEDATLLPASERASIRQQIRDAGIEFVGLHWLLVSPPGLKATAADTAERRRTWDYIHRAIDLCADLAAENTSAESVIVFGSPKQRSTTDGVPSTQGLAILEEELRRAGEQAGNSGVTVLLEAIPSAETNVVNTLEEAVDVVKRVHSPAVQTMFDVHNAADETLPHIELLRRFFPFIRHVHVNERKGGEPGTGHYDFAELLRALADLGYKHWISVESFDFSHPGHDIAARAIQTLRSSSPSALYEQTQKI